MPPLYQSRLGSAENQKLTILDLATTLSLQNDASTSIEHENRIARYYFIVRPSKNFMFTLPDELLVSIMEFAASGFDSRSQFQDATTYNKGMLLVLSRVSQRIRRIAQPLLFQHIDLAYPHKLVPVDKSVIKLHRTLKDRVDLRRYCRTLSAHISDGFRSSEASYAIAEDLIDWLVGTKVFSIHGGFQNEHDSLVTEGLGNHRTWYLLRRVVHKFKDLRKLSMSRYWSGPCLPEIFKWLDCPKLERLSIHGLPAWEHGVVRLDPEKRRTASFTSLSLSDYEEGPEATSLLLQWPAVLTHFELGSFYSNRHILDYPMFESWLLIHRHTLKRVEFGYLSNRGARRLFDATLFPHLEHLQLSRWQMASPVQFSPTDANVLGPSLKTFVWDFGIYDQHSEAWDAFGNAEATWVKNLAECAISRKTPLTTIKILFNPDNSYWNSNEEMGYPWDLMDRVREETMKPKGLNLVYTEPLVSKAVWLRSLRSENLGIHDEENPEDELEKEWNSSTDEEEEIEKFASELHRGYQGEDIRGYVVKSS